MLILALAVGTGGACKKVPRTPTESFTRLERAVAAGDAAAVFACLDQQARWSVESAFRDERTQRDIIAAKYPETAAPRALEQLASANAPNAAAFFAAEAKQRGLIARLRRRLGPVSGPIVTKPDASGVWVARKDGGFPFHFTRGKDGIWGFSELDREWELERDRESHALKTVRDNAELYKKAGQGS